MQLNPSEISELIRNKIQSLDIGAQTRTQGTVVSVTDGICRIHGLADVMQGEMLEFPGGTFGMALNLERDSVGAVVLGEYEQITEGDIVKTTGDFTAGTGCSQEGTYTNTWTVTDDCGNPSAVFTQVITVQDNTAPTWSTSADALNRTVECSDTPALAQAEALYPSATDNCDLDVSDIDTRRDRP